MKELDKVTIGEWCSGMRIIFAVGDIKKTQISTLFQNKDLPQQNNKHCNN